MPQKTKPRIRRLSKNPGIEASRPVEVVEKVEASQGSTRKVVEKVEEVIEKVEEPGAKKAESPV